MVTGRSRQQRAPNVPRRVQTAARAWAAYKSGGSERRFRLLMRLIGYRDAEVDAMVAMESRRREVLTVDTKTTI